MLPLFKSKRSAVLQAEPVESVEASSDVEQSEKWPKRQHLRDRS
jgi:hypothetical protein